MKKKTLNIIIAIGAVLIGISWFYNPDWLYYLTVTLFGAFMAWAIYEMIFRSIFIYLFRPLSKTYQILQGNNFSGLRIKPFFRRQKPFYIEVTLHESCEVPTEGIQKIFGLGDLEHHRNSFRYGFRYIGGHQFEIYTYEYKEGLKMPDTYLFLAETDKKFKLYFDADTLKDYPIGKYLFFYFEQDGDAEKGAPHNMYITVTIVKL